MKDNKEIEELLDKYGRNKKSVSKLLCNIANFYVLSIEKTWVWNILAKEYNLDTVDFYDDKEETIKKYGNNAVTVYGMRNWKWNELKKENSDDDKRFSLEDIEGNICPACNQDTLEDTYTIRHDLQAGEEPRIFGVICSNCYYEEYDE